MTIDLANHELGGASPIGNRPTRVPGVGLHTDCGVTQLVWGDRRVDAAFATQTSKRLGEGVAINWTAAGRRSNDVLFGPSGAGELS